MLSDDEVESFVWPLVPAASVLALRFMLLEWVVLPLRIELPLVDVVRTFGLLMPDEPEFWVELPVLNALELIPLACP